MQRVSASSGPAVTIPAPAPAPSRAIGKPFRGGRLVDGLQLPESGPDHLTWDPIREVVPNRPGRRWGTDRLLRLVLETVAVFRAAHPGDAPRVLIGDLSRPRGGQFGREFGGLGHGSHQNGLDVDVYYPRLDRAELGPRASAEVDRVRSQELVDLFVAGGAQFVFVGTKVGLKGPKKVVQAIPHHNDHLHVRIFNSSPRAKR